MDNNNVVLVAHQDKENLGVGYLTSFLSSKGYEVEILDFKWDHGKIYDHIVPADPILVGFSLIFQYYCDHLRDLTSFLRNGDVDCHFTVGGHYPSLRYQDILNYIPDLDSVVRFEGEYTLLELVEALRKNNDWRAIKSLAYVKDGEPVSNELRPLIRDLDSLPFPYRIHNESYQCMGVNYRTILASRGCVRNCSFCSIRRFYGTPPGKLRRTRSQRNVVREMKELYDDENTRIFLFQDDDFFLPGNIGREWVHGFTNQLMKAEIADDILWKISCRTDEVEYHLFKELQEVGLFLAYLGIETGNEIGLEVLNKQLKLEDNFRAIEVLNRLDMLYEMGFMLFDPSSTFDTVRENLTFLRKICGDGSSPVIFCKTIPYAETDIEKMLSKQGRLKGSVINPDYELQDPRLEDYCRFLHIEFKDWMFTNLGLMAKLRWHRFEVAALQKFYPEIGGTHEYNRFLREITASSNKVFLDFADKTLNLYEKADAESQEMKELIWGKENAERNIEQKLLEGMTDFQLRYINNV